MLASIGASRAQGKQSPVLIGFLHFGSRDSNAHLLAAFKDGLSALGWKEGTHVLIEERWANGRMDALQTMAAELAARKPALVVATSAQTVAAATRAAAQVPVVQATGTDPVAAGFAASLARPGGMVTGLSNLHVDVTEKLLELLLAATPKLRRVGFLTDSNNVNHATYMIAARRAVERHSVEGRYAEVERKEQIEPAIARLTTEGVQGVVVLGGVLFGSERQRIVKLALARRWPVIATARAFAEDGALLSYGVDITANYRRAAYYVDRILKGTRPGDLPIEQPTKLELVINGKTARLLGITIAQALMLQADKVIE